MPRVFDIDGFVAALPTDDRQRDPSEVSLPEYAYHRDDIIVAAEGIGLASCPGSIVNRPERKSGVRGWFLVPEAIGESLDTIGAAPKAPKAPKAAAVVAAASGSDDSAASAALALTCGDRDSLIPAVMSGYVRCDNFNTIERIVASRMFYPVFTTGLSGNGKTTMIDQVCAKLNRELFRVNITIETDEDDLLGGFRLVNGETVWQDGPVVAAMKSGGVLLLDEVDLASHKIMCLQPVLEGKGVYLKKINAFVRPAPGFTVIATANTKGAGDDSDKFVGTNVLNEAFLDRFPVYIEQDYPSAAQERKILTHRMKAANCEDKDFVENLVKWAQVIRNAYDNGASDDIITTRRLINIADAFSIFGDRIDAIKMAIARFSDETREEWINLYTKIDSDSGDDATAAVAGWSVDMIDDSKDYYLSKITFDNRIEARNHGFVWNPSIKHWQMSGREILRHLNSGAFDCAFLDQYGLTVEA